MNLKSAINNGLLDINQVMNICGVSEKTVYNWLSGKVRPNIDKVLKLERESNGVVKAQDWG